MQRGIDLAVDTSWLPIEPDGTNPGPGTAAARFATDVSACEDLGKEKDGERGRAAACSGL